MKKILLLSGPIAAGKTAVAEALVKLGFSKIRSGPYLQSQAAAMGRATDRKALQEFGDELDLRTDYLWVVSQVAAPTIEQAPETERWLFDAVRKKRQVEHFRTLFGSAVMHLHLTAPEVVLKSRYDARIAAGNEYLGNTPYEVAIRHPNELAARALIEIADVTCDTASLSAAAIASRIA